MQDFIPEGKSTSNAKSVFSDFIPAESSFREEIVHTTLKGAEKLRSLDGIGEKSANKLVKAGFDTPQKIVEASVEDLTKVVGKLNVSKIQAGSKKYIEQL